MVMKTKKAFRTLCLGPFLIYRFVWSTPPPLLQRRSFHVLAVGYMVTPDFAQAANAGGPCPNSNLSPNLKSDTRHTDMHSVKSLIN